MIQPLIKFENVSKSFGTNQVLKEVSLSIYQGEVTAIIGKSGVGKSVLLKHIIGLMQPDAGEIFFNGRPLSRMKNPEIDKLREKFSYVFQDTALFDSMTVRENIAFPLRGGTSLPKSEVKSRVEEKMKMFELQGVHDKYPSQISGGMKRRLMIARAMVNEPRLLILDEPTAGVDIEIRRSMWDFIKDINARGTTVILTTHYLEEAESLCRNIAIIDHGEIIKNTDMKSLLATLDVETFVLDLREAVTDCPRVEGMEIVMTDDQTLEASLPKQRSLNTLFAELDRRGMHVLSMRNKANRLEELFMRLVDSGQAGRRGAT